MDNAPRLNPCPFCGSEPSIIEVTICDTAIRCPNCPCRLLICNPPQGDSVSEAETAWNTRLAAPKVTALVDALVDAVAFLDGGIAGKLQRRGIIEQGYAALDAWEATQ